jgi:AraC family transcriptional regulator
MFCVYQTDYFESVAETRKEDWDEYARSLVAIRDRRLETLMQNISAELREPGFAREIMIEAMTIETLVEIERYVRRHRAASGRSASLGQSMAPWQLRRIQERIEASLEMGYPSLGDLAELCGISQSHLMRIFKASTGWPVQKFVAQARISTAKRLLTSGKLNSKEIAAKLGFNTPAYFASAFRRTVGMTPSAFRKQALFPGSSADVDLDWEE